MNYFLLSVCCVLISSTVGQSVELGQNCIEAVDEFLGKITLDQSVQKLADTSKAFNLNFFDFVAGEYIPLKDRHHKALLGVGYEKSCDGVLEHFKKMEKEVECFKPGSILELDEEDFAIANKDVIWAGLACSYTSKWRPEGRVESTPLYDFTGSSKGRTECIRERASLLNKVTLDDSTKNLLKLIRDHEITAVDFRYRERRPLDNEYVTESAREFPDESCLDLQAQIGDAIGGQKCKWKYLVGDSLYTTELSTMGHAGDILLANWACLDRIPDVNEHCRNKVAEYLGKISLDEQVMELVQTARKHNLTYVHLAATQYKSLDDERDGELRKIGYPDSCADIVKHFLKLPDEVKCARYKSFDFIKDWMQISRIKPELSDKVLAGWACAYAAKFDEKRPGTTETIAAEPFQPVKMIDDEKERLRLIGTLVSFGRSVRRRAASVEKVVEIARGCKLTFLDFMLAKYQPLNQECSKALLETDSWRSCEKLNNHINSNHLKVEFYQVGMSENLGVFLQFLAEPVSERVMLADEACEYIRKHGKKPDDSRREN